MDIKKRLKNKVFVATFLATVIGFVYQILGMFGVVPAVSQDQSTQIVGVVLNLLAALGVLVDPTTSGVSDANKEK